jgi:hypothetical protein
MLKRYSSFLFLLILFTISIRAQEAGPPDFTITKSFLLALDAQKTIQPVLDLHLDARTSKVHTLGNDCEIHIASTPEDDLGSPNSVVVEPPNLCKFFPPGVENPLSETKLRNEIWPDLLDEKVMDKDCKVKGFFRIFTEHASGDAKEANPNHVFEIHPAMSIIAGSDTLSFVKYLTVFDKMRKILPSTTLSCVTKRTLYVRFNSDDNQYEFREEGGRCGNFAIVEISNVNKDWVRTLNGGHAAIARVSVDGESSQTLKLYTLTSSEADDWIKGILDDSTQSNDRILLHGMITYDYYSIIQTLKDTDGQWKEPEEWEQIEYPIAFVVFGQTETIPWDE